MRIENSQQMLQHLNAGGNLALGKDGALQTQSSAAKFFQSVGDAFRGLSASGRATIATRNDRLYGAMAEMVRQNNPLPNMAAQGAQPRPPLDQTEKNTMMARIEVNKQMASFPVEARTGARKFLMASLQAQKQLRGQPAEVHESVIQAAADLKSKPAVLETLGKIGKPLSDTSMNKLADIIKNDMKATFAKPSQQAYIKGGIHDVYIKDARRHSIQSFNGQPIPLDPDAAVASEMIKNHLTTAIPDENMRAFVSTLASQAGGEGSLFTTLAGANGELPSDCLPSGIKLSRESGTLEAPFHKYTVTTSPDSIEVGLRMDVAYKLTTKHSPELGTHHYDVTFSIPQNQQLTPGQTPEFSVNLTMRPDGN